jgi:arginine N-succinyltransferase
VRDARELTVALADEVEAELPSLISTNAVSGFRAVRARVGLNDQTAILTRDVADALRVRAGDTVRVKA